MRLHSSEPEYPFRKFPQENVLGVRKMAPFVLVEVVFFHPGKIGWFGMFFPDLVLDKVLFGFDLFRNIFGLGNLCLW